MNLSGRRGPHFDAMLGEFASLLIRRSYGCCLLQGPFLFPLTVALAKVLLCWGSRLMWTALREHVAHVIRTVESHKYAYSFLCNVQRRGGTPQGRAGGQAGGVFAHGPTYGVDYSDRTAPVRTIPYRTVFLVQYRLFHWGFSSMTY